MKIIHKSEKSRAKSVEGRGVQEAAGNLLIRTIIDFESGRKALEKIRLEEEQSRRTLVKRSRLQGSLGEDRLEFLLTIALVFALLLGLYVGLIGSWQF